MLNIFPGRIYAKGTKDIYVIKLYETSDMVLCPGIVEKVEMALQWRHNGHISVSNHQPDDCLLKCLFSRRSKKTPKLRITGLCAGNSPGTGEFSAQMASNAENACIW